MFIQIKLKDKNAAYSDHGLAISGGEPIILELTPFVCGLIYRNEAEIYESPNDKVNSKSESDIENLSWIELKKLALDNNLDIRSNPNKKQLIEALKGKLNDVL
jgi:organic radical activating enzyme